jgi:hypothetical protein
MSTEQLIHPGFGGGPAKTDDFEPTEQPLAGNVGVIHGIYTHSFPLAGMTVRRARAELAERLNVAPDAVALVDGNEVSDDFLLAEGQVLNFVKDGGEKGTR